MNSVLELCRNYPERLLAEGETLIEEGVRGNCLYVLKHGSLRVMRAGVTVTRIGQPGAIVGEISALLECAPSATLVACEPSSVYVISDASTVVRSRAALTLAVAQVLARRLLAVTGYLVDIKRQYAGTNSHLALMDQVLAELTTSPHEPAEIGSERQDVPDY